MAAFGDEGDFERLEVRAQASALAGENRLLFAYADHVLHPALSRSTSRRIPADRPFGRFYSAQRCLIRSDYGPFAC